MNSTGAIALSNETQFRVRGGLGSRLIAVVVLIILAAVVISIALWSRLDGHQREVEVRDLVAASSALSDRPVASRLTGGFPHRPPKNLQRSSGTSRATKAEMRLSAIASQIRATSGDRHAVAIAQAVQGDLDTAIRSFDAILAEQPSNPAVLNDLSAAHYARGELRNHASDIVSALHFAEQAWRVRQTTEVAWNRALAVSALYLPGAGERAWDDVLRIEPDAAWQREAVERRALLRPVSDAAQWERLRPQLEVSQAGDAIVDRAVQRFPEQVRVYLEDQLLPAYAFARRDGSAEVASLRAKAFALATRLAARGEHFPLDALSAIDNACRESWRCAAIADAHARFETARQRYSSSDFVKAARAFAAAESAFAVVPTPYLLRARIERIGCMFHHSQFDRAAAESRDLLNRLDADYRYLRARILWFIGLCEVHAAHPEESIARYEEALQLFQGAGDRGNAAAMEGLLADALELAGSPDEANEHRRRALAGILHSGNTARYALTVYEAACGAAERGRHAAAEALFEEALQAARATTRFDVAALSALWRSSLAWRRGDSAEAVQHASLAKALSSDIPDRQVRNFIDVSRSQTGGGATVVQDAKRTLDDTIEFFREAGSDVWLPQLLRQRAGLLIADGDVRGAERDLREAVGLCEAAISADATLLRREGLSGDVRDIYSDLTGLLLRQKRSHEALVVAERWRRLGTGLRRDPDLASLMARLPASAWVVVHEVQTESVVTWLIGRASTRTFYKGTGRQFSRTLASVGGAVPSHDTLRELFDVLIAGWYREVPPGATLFFVPPPELRAIPWAALYDRTARRYVIDDFRVATAYTIAGAVAASERRKVVARRSPLIVADPAYDPLPRLPDARAEAVALRRLYNDANILMDAQATKSRFLAALPSAAMLHYAGHASANQLTPEMSALLFAGGDGEGRLYLHEIPRLPALELVVLSACSTASTRGGTSDGNVSLARAFLDRGATHAVGTLWPVSDDAAAAFSVRLHEEWVDGRPAVEAMHEAQVALKNRDGRPHHGRRSAYRSVVLPQKGRIEWLITRPCASSSPEWPFCRPPMAPMPSGRGRSGY